MRPHIAQPASLKPEDQRKWLSCREAVVSELLPDVNDAFKSQRTNECTFRLLECAFHALGYGWVSPVGRKSLPAARIELLSATGSRVPSPPQLHPYIAPHCPQSRWVEDSDDDSEGEDLPEAYRSTGRRGWGFR